MDRIIMHEDVQPSEFLTFTRQMAILYRTLPIPEISDVKGVMAAVINHGRWLCICPTCGSAAYVSNQTPLFWCVECASPENGHKWYRVLFPTQRQVIEKELLKRPYIRGRGAPSRNWEAGETIAKLKAENIERGIR